MKKTTILALLGSALALGLGGCATETSRVVTTPQVAAVMQPYSGPRVAVSIGKFDNRSGYLQGIFADKVDRIGSQAKTILTAHLNQSNRFGVLDRENLSAAQQEAQLLQQAQSVKGANFLVTGDVTEFGRKEVGDQQLFGLLGRGKEQVAYAKVTLNVVNVKTSEVVYSTQGAGEFALSNREVLGFGGTASYDATLSGKVLDLAIREAVDKLAQAVDRGALK